ncbi:MAG: ankyrin repeat domain-containing protein [Bdellovibrionales bacterium]|nr:ankyrin repeat domain-containing protein [Bdellovibrionales bacterium]
MKIALFFCFLYSFTASSSTPPELFYKKDGKFVSLGSFSSMSFCSGKIPIEDNKVTIYCRNVPDIGPQIQKELPQVLGTYPCSNGQIQGVVKIQNCWGYSGEESYDNGLKSGTTKYFYSNGLIKSEAQYLNGQLNGTSTQYLEDGTIVSKVEYKNDLVNGKSYFYDQYAKVSITSFYVNGVPKDNAEYESKYLQEPLIIAAGNGDLINVKKYLSKGATPNGFGESTSTQSAVFKAAISGKLEILAFLISKGGNVNQFDKFNSRTPLMATVQSPKTTQYLLDNGADPKIKNSEGNTALHIAVYYGYLETAELLIKKGVDLNSRDKDGKTPSQIAESSTHKDRQKFIDLLNGTVSAQLATKNRQLEECKEKMKFLARYVEVNGSKWEDEFKNCPKESYDLTELNNAFQLATQKGLIQPMESLLNIGAQLNSREQNYQCTPLMLAARQGKIESVKFLLKKKADLNIQDNFGKTAIMYAVQWSKNKEIVKLLLDSNVDINLKNKDGQTARDLARQGNLPEIEKLLTK